MQVEDYKPFSANHSLGKGSYDLLVALFPGCSVAQSALAAGHGSRPGKFRKGDVVEIPLGGDCVEQSAVVFAASKLLVEKGTNTTVKTHKRDFVTDELVVMDSFSGALFVTVNTPSHT